MQNMLPSEQERKPSYVLDAFATFAVVQKEKGEKRVVDLIEQAQEGRVLLHLSLINWGEILYTIEREQGADLAREISRIWTRHPSPWSRSTVHGLRPPRISKATMLSLTQMRSP